MTPPSPSYAAPFCLFHSQFLCITNTIRIKRFVQESSGNSSAKKSKRERFTYFTFRGSALRWSASGSEATQGSPSNEIVT